MNVKVHNNINNNEKIIWNKGLKNNIATIITDCFTTTYIQSR